MAYDAACEGLRAFPDHVRLRQLLALALARMGASAQANSLLRQLRDAGHADEETLGMLARTHKDLAASSRHPAATREHLSRAYDAYHEAHCRSGGYWSGINAATTALLLGDRDEALATAERVRGTCTTLIASDPAPVDRYWILATLGEAALVLGDTAEAVRWYAQAASVGRDRLGDLVSTRRNARLILRHLGRDTAGVDACFTIPRVVVFAGHLIDRPGRAHPRFPPSLEPAVTAAILRRLATLGAVEGYASAACGSDLIFLEALAAMGAPSHIVLPFDHDHFLPSSVDLVPGADWARRFEAALGHASDVLTASDRPIGGGGVAYEYAFRLLDGTAGLRAEELDTELVCLAVWDGQPGDGGGGTAMAVEHWFRRGRTVEVIDLAQLRQHARLTPGVNPPDECAHFTPRAAQGRRFEPRIVGLLFADAPGFSQLNDADLPIFVDRFLGAIRQEISRLDTSPLLVNTWGDGLYMVFGSPREAGVFALRLGEAILGTHWQALGLSTALSIRIGLHAGPAYACIDPVTGRSNYLGAHVSRAARIEPITPPGTVYASSAFAALARADGVDEFTCVYVGPMPLAKGYGTFPTYLVKAAT
jgi:class 3 adenylate cyclase/tetratricopeptide (TPR) repeat protein